MTDRAERVFVYGTLRRGQPNHRLLAGAHYLGTHVTPACYTMLDLGTYPAVIEGGATAVVGEVYAVDRALLARLDRFEDCPGEYARRRIDTPYGAAWIYLYSRTPRGKRPIASGDWVRR